MIDLTWMAWTWQTAAFFIGIGLLLASMTMWEIVSPGGAPRHGILGIETTRGDRLFLSLVGAAFIHLAWLGLVGPDVLWASGISLIYALAVFRWV
jgi:predicted small integral membrane protein